MAYILHNINLFLTNEMAKVRKASHALMSKLANFIWYEAKWLWIGLVPLEFLYRIGLFYKKNRTVTHESFAIPVVVVGNITVGGTGKSPFVIALAQFLMSRGYHPGIISRGYGGKRLHPELPFVVTATSNPVLVGDEPVMIARATALPFVISTDRVRATRFLIERFPQCDIVISDDGLQHYRLWRDVTICLVDGMRQFGNKRCLPAGPLREPLSMLSKFDFVIENGGDKSTMLMKDESFYQVGNISNKVAVQYFAGKTVHAVSGIGNPERFFTRLTQLGIKVIPHVFPDHYLFSAKDIQFNDKLPIVMTEKDAVKCAHIAGSDTWFLRIRLELGATFREQLFKKLLLIKKLSS